MTTICIITIIRIKKSWHYWSIIRRSEWSFKYLNYSEKHENNDVFCLIARGKKYVTNYKIMSGIYSFKPQKGMYKTEDNQRTQNAQLPPLCV